MVSLCNMDSIYMYLLVGSVYLQLMTSKCQDNSTCLNGGTVQSDGSCQCLPNLSGDRCQVLECDTPDEDYCTSFAFFLCDSVQIYNYSLCAVRCGNCPDVCTKECQNGGILDTVDCRCDCPVGYFGEFCQDRVSDCRFKTCFNGGFVNTGTCDCVCPPSGIYSGKNCELVNCSRASDSTFCDPTERPVICNSEILAPVCPVLCGLCSTACAKQCVNGGTLNNVLCTCDCPLDYRGEFCQERVCNNRQCLNGGIQNPVSCACDCPQHYLGEFCQERVCTRECLNGGEMAATSCTCDCPQGYSGEICQEKGCTKPCLNGGTSNSASCTCDCPQGYCGELCQERDCSTQTCLNGGLVNVDTCECVCLGIYSGEHCEIVNCTRVSDAAYCDPTAKSVLCSSEPLAATCPVLCGLCTPECKQCLNGGTADSFTGRCNCRSEWTGAQCEIPVAPTTATPTTSTSTPTPAPTCCTPPSIPNTEVTVGDGYVDYRCKKGSVNTGGNNFKSSVNEDGSWTNTNFVCTDVSTCYVLRNRIRVYTGNHSIASDGRRCQAWNQQIPNRHRFQDFHFRPATGDVPETLEEAGNYCRDPGRGHVYHRLWCYNGEGVSPRIIFCDDIPPCKLNS